MTISDKIKSILKTIPTDPGVYRYYDDKGEIIYVGKAKNLKRRVHSYFNKQQQSRKVSVLVSRINDIRFTVVNSEMEALLLENNFIKQVQRALRVKYSCIFSIPYPNTIVKKHSSQKTGVTYIAEKVEDILPLLN